MSLQVGMTVILLFFLYVFPSPPGFLGGCPSHPVFPYGWGNQDLNEYNNKEGNNDNNNQPAPKKLHVKIINKLLLKILLFVVVKLDGVGPVDNRPSTAKLHLIVRGRKKSDV